MNHRYNRIATSPEFNRLLDSIEKLERDRIYCGHDLTHLLDVARIAYIRVIEEDMDYDRDIIYAAALLHDIGRAEEYSGGDVHDIAGPRVAAGILRECGYGEDEIEVITKAIGEHGEDGGFGLGALLHRADKESRMCFRCDASDTCKWKRKNEGIER